MKVMKLADIKRNEGGTNMKKRLFSILLCLAMVLTLLPTAALAAGSTAESASSTMSVTIGGTTTYYDSQEEGWNYANGTANTNGATVQPLADWTAAYDSTYGTSFGTGTGFFYGSINVPKGKTITLDLNGHNINRNLTAIPTNKTYQMRGNVIHCCGYLTLTDTSSEDVSKQGKITGGYTTSNGGGIQVDNNNNANEIAGVLPKLTMLGGRITGNHAQNGGGVVLVRSNFTMSGGETFQNDGGTYGGGVGNFDGLSVFTINGGKISGNTAVYGGGIYAQGTTSSIVISSGEISGNSATYGGGIYAGSVSGDATSGYYFTMTGGCIIGNNAKTFAGGLYEANSKNLNYYRISGAPVISGNVVGGTLDASTGLYTKQLLHERGRAI